MRVLLLTGRLLAVKTWGLVVLTPTALAMVPVMFTVLILIARPRPASLRRGSATL